MDFELKSFPEDVKEELILNQISEWNNSQSISGYIVQLPLPQHIDEQKIISAIRPEKDVDGFHPVNQGKLVIWDNSWLLPCTPAGIMEILRSYDISLRGKNVCVLGRSNIVWKPIALLCVNAWATVTVCNSATKNISDFTKKADIIITATGQAQILTADMVQSDSIIIDVGFSVVDGKIFWDADTNACLKKWASITPVPGGVWPMTVAMLLSNTLTAFNYEKSR